MENYEIEIKKSAQKELEKLPKKDIQIIVEKINGLCKNPRGPNSIKLSGDEKYRMRVGRYRVLYEIVDQVLMIYVIKIAHRKEVYR
ncbi:MAG: type II toxin-antitoxin system RelE/ParE family toxin [Bdellovibrionota bacterium]